MEQNIIHSICRIKKHISINKWNKTQFNQYYGIKHNSLSMLTQFNQYMEYIGSLMS